MRVSSPRGEGAGATILRMASTREGMAGEGTGCRRAGGAQIGGPRGGAALAWLVLACALAAGLVALWMSRQEPPAGDGGPAGRTAAGAHDPTDVVPSTAGRLDAPDDQGPRTIGTIETRPAGLDGGLERTYDGTGTIAGQVSLEDGSPPPAWVVHLEPSAVAPGRASADARTYEAGPREETFELRDVPMGAYRAYATAEGYRSRPQEVALYRLDGPGDPKVDHVTMTFVLRPLAHVDGRVRRATGEPAEGLPVHLVPRESLGDGRARDGEPLTVTTDIAGAFRFDAVPPGAWQVRLGSAARPLAAALPLTVASAPVRLDEQTLPPLATIDLLVMDEVGRPFPDVEIVGYLRGAGSGALRGRTDPLGHYTADYLPPGPWRVEATYAPQDMRGRKDWAFEASDEVQVLEMVIR